MLVLALTVPASYAVSMLLPYYANGFDRLPLEEMPWGTDSGEVWPYDTAFGLPAGLAAIYALACGPFVAMGIVVWAGFWTTDRWRSATWSARVLMVSAAAVSLGTITWLMTSPLASTLASWFMD